MAAPTKQSTRKGAAQFWLALAVGVLVVGFSLLNFYESIELKMLDQRYVLRNWLFGAPRQIPNLATIDVDDYSVDQEGRFEDWDRTYHARVLNIVGALGAKEVGIDFLLPEPSTPMVRETQVQASDINTRQDILSLFQNPDHILADMARQWHNTYYAQYLTESEEQDYDRSLQTNPRRTPEQELRFRSVMPFTLPINDDYQKNLIVGSQLWAPVDTLIATAKGVGQVQPIPDMDGIVRRNRAFYLYDGRIFPALSLVMACDYLNVPLKNMRIEPGRAILPNAQVPGESRPRDIEIPIGARGTILINWAGDYRSTYRHYPYSSIRTFWENYQRDRLARAAKQELANDPSLLTKMLGGEVDLTDFTIRLMLQQASLPHVDVLRGVQDIAVAIRMDALLRHGAPFEDAVREVFGQPSRALRDAAHWRELYGSLEVNWRLSRMLIQNPGLTEQEAASALNVPPAALSRAFAQLRPLASPTTGRIPPRRYPLWFFERTIDGTPLATRDDANARLAMTIKQYLRMHAMFGDSVIASITSDDPEYRAKLGDAAIRLVAIAANFPDQDYSAVIGAVVQAALLEPFIAEGATLEGIISDVFGASLQDLPEEVVKPYRATYDMLKRNLELEKLVNAYPAMTVAAAAESLSTFRKESLMKADPTLTAASAESLSFVRTSEIAGDFYVLADLVKQHGKVPAEAHPLVFYTVVVDEKPVFASDFKDAVMFYGITSTGGHDRNPIPFEPRYPMVGMHLNLFNQIVTGQFLHRPDTWVNWLLIIGIALLMGLFVPRLSPTYGGAAMGGVLVAFLAIALILFSKWGLWIDTVGPLAAIVFTYLAITVRNYIVEEKEKKFIKGAFSAYLAPEVVDIIANDPSGLKLGGEPANITAFFSDVKGFSTISEALTPTELVELLNEYLTEMCEIAFKYRATVDKFIGDAIVAFYGAPIRYDDHAVRACLTAVEMQRRLAELRKKWQAEGKHEIFARIGLNSGNAVVGNMGGRSRFNYTMMGDTVNLAARLESGAKQFGVYTMITEATYQAAKEVVDVRELDRIIVIGKKEPVTIYEILEEKGRVPQEKQKVMDLYQEGLSYYREQRWEDAIAKYRAAMAADSNHPDATSGIMIGRCESILAGKVEIPKKWNGVWEMTEK